MPCFGIRWKSAEKIFKGRKSVEISVQLDASVWNFQEKVNTKVRDWGSVFSMRWCDYSFDVELTNSLMMNLMPFRWSLHSRHIRIRNFMDRSTASTISTSLIHSKIDYCNSLLLNLSATQINHLQLVLNSTARAVTRTPKFHHITPTLKSLHWLTINQRIE